jgi:hypothetical protein
MKYLKNSDISLRFNLNPFNWKWIPKVVYEGPTPFYPKRRTYALVVLFLQVFVDLDDGSHDMSAFHKIFDNTMDAIDEKELGLTVPGINKTNLDLE